MPAPLSEYVILKIYHIKVRIRPFKFLLGMGSKDLLFIVKIFTGIAKPREIRANTFACFSIVLQSSGHSIKPYLDTFR